MKKIFLSILAFLLLSSCFGRGGDLFQGETGLVGVEKDDFSLSLPVNWQEVFDHELTTPSQGEIVLAYRAEQVREGYYNNIVILKNQNRLQETDIALMNNNINTLKLSMQSFDIITEDTLNFGRDSQGNVIVFKGQYGLQTPTLHYIQTAKSCGEESFFLTISIGSDLVDYTRYYPLLESFRCK
ncbi:hypothetical protein LAT59_01390 [Candidatus Gracilibacteria bacterium]|nr:hypothetical protein [Candidatus Gracilibacteria bacterium]